MSTAVTPTVSIVVCTHNRAKWLLECLQSVFAQVEKGDDLEVVVVDNNSTDATRAVVEGLLSKFHSLRYVFEPVTGLAHARDRGIHEAAGEWICFLDDDARALEGFILKMRHHARANSFACIGGVFEPWYPELRTNWFRDEFASNAHVSQDFGELPPDRFVAGGIMLVRKNALLEVGGFEVRIGMRGGRIGYGEETLLQVKLRRAGHAIGFDPDWRIEHRVKPEKQTVAWQLRSAWAWGRDGWIAYDKKIQAKYLAGLVHRVFTRAVRGLIGELVARDRRRSWQTWMLAASMPMVATAAELTQGVRLGIAKLRQTKHQQDIYRPDER